MDFSKVKRTYHTLKYLKYTQIFYQIKYRFFRPKRISYLQIGTFTKVDLVDFPKKQKSLSIDGDNWSFNFLNLKYVFSRDSPEWYFKDYGLLWNYNFNYFDWIHQDDLTKGQCLETILKFYKTSKDKNPIIFHPYPTSLRIINLAKFISSWDVGESWLYNELVLDLTYLSKRIEYHLLGNHLLENAFALYIGGIISGQTRFIQKGKKLIISELNEQVLNDGMHYERSPMYHLIILERVLDALNFAKATKDDLESVLKIYAIKMSGLAMNWKGLKRIPMMQDSAYDISLTVSDILKYSKNLLLEDYPSKPNDLDESGYRILNSGCLKLFANVGSIGPTYQPGHAHADELNFELFLNGAPIIVDSGISTYDKNYTRQKERSTSSHNCITLNGNNSSDVWSGFRVAKRAKINLFENKDFIKASHNGYKDYVVSRKWKSNNDTIIIIDSIETSKRDNKNLIKGKLHFHPKLSIQLDKKGIVKVGNELTITFSFTSCEEPKFEIEEYNYAQGFNNLKKAKVLTYTFHQQIKITIHEGS